MDTNDKKGNDPELWNKLLEVLDEKLQFGLLSPLKNAACYQFEGNTLNIEAGNDQEREYLSQNSALQQLKLFAQDACGVNEIIIK